MRLAALAGAALALLVALVAYAPATASAAAPPRFVGLQGWQDPSGDDFPRLTRARVGLWRTNFNWGEVQPGRGEAFDWSRYDALVSNAAAHGVQILPILIGSPSWASSRGVMVPHSAEGRAAYYEFVAAAVRRYGPGGTFWRDHAGEPIVYWQIWNEPNLPNYWGTPNPRDYGGFLKAASRAVRGASRRARVVAAGLPEGRGMSMTTFLTRMYRVRGVKKAFDVVAIHPYARDYRGVLGALDRSRRVLARYRDTRKRIWITEIGWGSAGPPDSRGFTTTEAGQASRLRTLYRVLLRKRRTYKLLGAIWFSYRDLRLGAGDYDWWAVHTGLFDPDGRAKPAWDALLGVTGGSR